MQFSQTPHNTTPKIQQKWWDRFTSQPHQLYFTSAIFFSLLVMFVSFLSFLGTFTIDFGLFHGFGLIYVVFTNAFLGFLITVMPKYNASKVISKDSYLKPWFIFQLGAIFALSGFIFIGKILIVLVMLYFVKIFYNTIKIGNATNKQDSIFLNLVFLFGAVFLFIEAILSIDLSLMIFFAYLLSLVFLVAQRMIPAFYSGYMQIAPWKKPERIREISIFLLFSIGICIEFELQLFLKLVSFLAMIFFGYIIINLNIYKKTPAILTILILPFIWLGIGFITLFIESVFEIYSLKLSLHIFALGFIATLLIGFGSRVVMGHAIPAQQITTDKLTEFIFILTQVVVISRIVASVLFLENSNIFTGILHLSSWLWIVVFLLWSIRYGKTLLRLSS